MISRDEKAVARVAAVERVHDLEQDRIKIQRRLVGLQAVCADYQKRDQVTSEAFFESYGESDLHELIQARSLSEAARQIAGALQAQLTTADLVGKLFRRAHPDWREALRDAADVRLSLAKRHYEQVLSEEKKRLPADKYSPEEIDESPPIKHAKKELDAWHGMVRSIGEAREEIVWQDNVKPILNGAVAV